MQHTCILATATLWLQTRMQKLAAFSAVLKWSLNPVGRQSPYAAFKIVPLKSGWHNIYFLLPSYYLISTSFLYIWIKIAAEIMDMYMT